MKNRTLSAVLALVLALTLAGCGEEQLPQAPDEGIDIDFTQMNSVLQSSQLVNMVENVDDYRGKTVRMNGAYDPFYVENLDEWFQYIKIDCPSGCDKFLEFKYDSLTYPDDYPKIGTRIEITGVFDTYDYLDWNGIVYLDLTEFKIV